MSLNVPVSPFPVKSISAAQAIGSIANTTEIDHNTETPPNAIPPAKGDEISQEFEDELSEQQLRELYDREEIDRFLNLFATYVTEVRLPERVNITRGKEAEPGACESTEDLNTPPLSTPDAPTRDLSEYIAYQYIIPNLPAAPLPRPLFTFRRLQVTTQRCYLAVEPAYRPFFTHLKRLAMWQDRQQSLIYCAIFWVLWWYNLLLPSLFLRIFFALARRKILPYPTIHELRKRRKEVARANVFGDEIEARLTPLSPFGLTELWRLFKIFNKPKVERAKSVVEDEGKEGKGRRKTANTESGENKIKNDFVSQKGGETPTVLDDSADNSSKHVILEVLNGVADLHERVKNIFIWRRPASSYMYGGLVLFLFLVTLLLPAKYIAKLLYATGGILFWHVTPIIAAIPPTECARLPPAFHDVPTDADYAMNLISQRVAAGLDVKPSSFKTPEKRKAQTHVEADGGDTKMSENGSRTVDWKKWGDRAATWKGWMDSGKRVFTRTELQQIDASTPHNSLPGPDLHSNIPYQHVETRTFLAQHNSAPGLITLTPAVLFFTPLISTNARITITLRDLRGIKKIGLFKGLSLLWRPSQDDSTLTEREEKFMWVGDRDELFARLIGQDGRRWLKAC